MALYALPTKTENAFAAYISGGYSGTYTVTPAFTPNSYILPLIIVKAGNFRQYEPDTHLYQGNCMVSVVTQIDDAADPLTTHDNTVAAVYDLLADKAALGASVNATAGGYHLVNADIVSYEQEVNSAESSSFISMIELEIYCQTLAA